jgi:hypothetical protein
VEVFISADKVADGMAYGPGDNGDLASLRTWLDAPDVNVPWQLAPESPAAGTLGSGVDGICAVITSLEGLPPLIQWIRSWSESKQEPAPITVTITIAGRPQGESTR